MEFIYKYPSVTAKVLRSLRLKNNFTQKYISKVYGKSRSTISRIERAIKKLSTLELKEYLEILNTTYEEFEKTLSSLNLLNDYGAHLLDNSGTEHQNIESTTTSLINNREAIIKFLKDYFADKPVKEVFLFGSVARNSHNANSDIDIYIDFDKSVKVSVFDLSKMKIEITTGTGRETDLVMKGSEYSFLKDSLESEKVKIYG